MASYEIEIILNRQLADCLSIPVFITDTVGNLIFYNEPADKILGTSFEDTGEMKVEEWSTIFKPLDEEAVLASIKKTKCAVTAEEHNIIGGLGDSIAQVAAKNFPIPIEMVGTKDTFGESGKPMDLLKKYGLDVVDIVAAAEKVMSRK